jgi:hypothetical protein
VLFQIGKAMNHVEMALYENKNQKLAYINRLAKEALLLPKNSQSQSSSTDTQILKFILSDDISRISPNRKDSIKMKNT